MDRVTGVTYGGLPVEFHEGVKPGTIHVLSPASLDEALDAVEKPEDCSDESCFRNGGSGPCRCEEGDIGTTAAPGGW